MSAKGKGSRSARRSRKAKRRLESDDRQVELLPGAEDASLEAEGRGGGGRGDGSTAEPADHRGAPGRPPSGRRTASGADAIPAPGSRDDRRDRPDASPQPSIGGRGRSGGAEPDGGDRPGRESRHSSGAAPTERATGAPVALPGPRPQGNQLARARDLVERGRIEEAVEQYRAILLENPTNLKAHHNLGVLFDELGRPEDALDHFEEAQRIQPDNVDVLTNHASTLTSLGRFEAADELLRRALRGAPDDLPARLAAAVLAFKKGLYAAAELELRWVCERDSGNGPAFYYRAEALNRIGRFVEAEPLMLRAAELLPSDSRPFLTLGHLYDRQERHQDAAEMYRRARDLQAR